MTFRCCGRSRIKGHSCSAQAFSVDLKIPQVAEPLRLSLQVRPMAALVKIDLKRARPKMVVLAECNDRHGNPVPFNKVLSNVSPANLNMASDMRFGESRHRHR